MPDNVFLIGRILQKYRLVTDEQFDQVVRAHEQTAGRVPVGDLLLSQGLLTSEQALWLERAVRHYETQVAAGHKRVMPAEGVEQPGRRDDGESPSREVTRIELNALAAERLAGEPLLDLPLSDTPQVPPPGAMPLVPVEESGRTPVEGAEAALEILPEDADVIEEIREDGEPESRTPEPEPPRRPEPEPLEARPGAPRPRTAIGRVAIGALRIGDGARRRRESDEAGPVDELGRLIGEAARAGASDLILPSGQLPALRVAGELQRLPPPRGGGEFVDQLLPQLLSAEQQRALRAEGEVTFVHACPSGRCRATVVQRARGFHLALRLLPPRPQSPEELGLPPQLVQLLSLPAGLLLCAGPAGSGRSATLAALIDHLNGRRAARIAVLELAPEYVHRPRRGQVYALRPGADLLALGDALAHDVDVVALDELRPSQLAAALDLAEGGRLVLGTLLAADATAALQALLHPFSGEARAALRRRLGRVLVGVAAQRLLRRASGQGRVAAVELLLGTPAVLALVQAERLGELTHVALRERERGHRLLPDALHALVEAGAVSDEEARAQLHW